MSEVEVQQSPGAAPPALVALIAPEAGMERQAALGGVKLAFFLCMLCALFSAFAQASRVDLRAATLVRLDKDQKLATMSDKQVDDEVKGAERLSEVMKVAWGTIEAPLFLLLNALAAVTLIWFLKGKIKGRAIFPIAAAAMLPNAVGDLLNGAIAFVHSSIDANTALAPRTLSAIFAAIGPPLSEPWIKLGDALDFYSLWGAILFGFGIAFAGGLPKRRALTGALLAWASLELLVHVAAAGAMAGGK